MSRGRILRKGEAGADEVRPAEFLGAPLTGTEPTARDYSFPVISPQPEGPAGRPAAAESRPSVPALTAAVLLEAQRAGREEGLAKAESEVRDRLLRARGALSEISALAGKLRAQAVLDAIELGAEIARQVLDRELSLRPEEVVGIARRGIARLGGRKIRIKANPEDVPLLESASEFEQSAEVVRLEIVPDPEVERGGVVVESELGVADARLESQVRELVRAAQEAGQGGEGG